MKSAIKAIISLTLVSAAVVSAHAQDYPQRPVKLIATFPPGGGADLTARIIGQKLAEIWKQPVLTENRTGAGGNIGADFVFRAPDDGYTVLVVSSSQAVNAAILAKPTFDLLKDFEPVVLTTSSPVVLAVNNSVKVKNLAEFTSLVRANPDKYSYGTCGIATTHHFAMAQYRFETKTQAVHIPMQCATAITAAVGGQVDVIAVTLPGALPFVKSGQLKALGVTSATRSALAPDIPTFEESGVPELKNFAVENYYGFMVKAGTSQAIVKKLNADIRAALGDPEVQKRLTGAGMDVFLKSPAQTTVLLAADVARYRQIAAAAGIKQE